jgi:hypothetical protein
MHERTVLGAADVSDDVLAAMVAAQLGQARAAVELRTSRVEPVAYDLDAITTGGRFWVSGEALVGGAEVPYRFFVKVVQSFSRSTLFDLVPPDVAAMAAASVPWRTEPLVYRSDLAGRLPAGLGMPSAYGVFDLDDLSASIWLEVVTAPPVAWDLDRFRRAAHLLGRLAASPLVAERAAVGASGWHVGHYAEGRVRHQVLPMLFDDGIWHHPLVAGAYDDELRDRLRDAAARLDDVVDELRALPVLTGHGDACPNNLLAHPADPGAFVLIDFGFWGELPVAFDLGQLLVGDVQIGRRPARDLAAIDGAIVPAYCEGLAAEGSTVPPADVARAHALHLLLFTGISTLPFEHLDRPPSPELHALAADRAALSRFSLDLAGC